MKLLHATFFCLLTQLLVTSDSVQWSFDTIFSDVISWLESLFEEGFEEASTLLDDIEDLISEYSETLEQLISDPENAAAIILADIQAAKLRFEEEESVAPDPDGVKFFLYTNQSNLLQRTELQYNNSTAIASSGYNSSLPIVLVIHGFMGNSEDPTASEATIKNGYFSAEMVQTEINLVLVDWSSLSGLDENLSSADIVDYATLILAYLQATENVQVAAGRICQFLQFLLTNSFLPQSSASISIVGHSLGAHVGGLAGDCLKKNTQQQIDLIVGIDPAGPLFQDVPLDERLDAGDASYVIIIHSNQYEFGYVDSLGTVDFYMGGNYPFQKQCQGLILPIDTSIACSHNYAPRFFVLSLLNANIPALCYSDYRSGSCSANVIESFGISVPRGTTGPYIVTYDLAL